MIGTLVLELTETILFSESDEIDRILQVKRLGVRIALDDFGTGYSSLSYLRRVPVDFLKVLAATLFGDDPAGLRGDVTAALGGDAAVTC